MLFRIEGTRSFLLGSMHFLPHGTKMPPSWADAYRKTNRLVVEAKLDEQSTLTREYQDASTLRDHVPEDLVQSLRPVCDRLNLSADKLFRHHPWSAGLCISIALHLRNGRKPPGTDAIFFRRANDAKKPIGFLESIDDGLGSVAKVDGTQIIASLRRVSSDIERALRQANELYDAWVAEDPPGMLLSLSDMDLFPDFRQKVFLDRNAAWIPAIVREIQGELPALIVVGGLHLVGPGSVCELLENGGYSLTHIPRR